MPQREGRLIGGEWFVGESCWDAYALREADLIDESGAADHAFDQSRKTQFTGDRLHLGPFVFLVGHLLAIDEQPDSFEFEDHRDVMPLVVAEHRFGAAMIGSEAGEIDRERAARHREQFPMRAGRLRFVSDQNVVSRFVRELRPALNGQRELTELIATLHQRAAASSVESLAELAFD